MKKAKGILEIEFSVEPWKELQKLQKMLDAENKAEVVRSALGVLGHIVTHIKKGNKVLIERKDGTQSYVKYKFLKV